MMTEDETIEQQGRAQAAGDARGQGVVGDVAERGLVSEDPFNDDTPLECGIEDPEYCESCT